MDKIVRFAYYPVTVLGLCTLAALLLNVMSQYSVILIIAVLCLIQHSIFERLFPHQKKWNIKQGDYIADLIHTNALFPIVNITTQSLVILSLQFISFNPLIDNVYLEFIFFLLLCELGYYAYHRLVHTNRSLWLFHAIHHGSKRIYLMNSARFHPVDSFLSSLVYFVPLIIFDVSEVTLFSLAILNLVTGYLEHSNVDYQAGKLNLFFNSANLHRWHHSKTRHCNFGKILSVWDLVFKTYYLPKNSVSEIGLMNDPDVPNHLLGQWSYPFKQMRKK